MLALVFEPIMIITEFKSGRVLHSLCFIRVGWQIVFWKLISGIYLRSTFKIGVTWSRFWVDWTTIPALDIFFIFLKGILFRFSMTIAFVLSCPTIPKTSSWCLSPIMIKR